MNHSETQQKQDFATRSIHGVSYNVYGSGSTTVVLLRGLGRWSDHWLGFEKVLVAKGLRVISVDNRGFGKSQMPKPEKNLRLDMLADDVALIIAKEAPNGAHVVGVSLGGMIGLALAAHRPQLVKSLLVVNSSVASAKLRRLSNNAVSALASVTLRAKRGYQKLAQCLLGDAVNQELIQKLAKEWSAIDQDTKPQLGMVWSQLMAAKKFGGDVEMASIKCPVTIVKSEKDLFVDPANSDYIHKNIRGSTIVRHPTAGHELAFEDPSWFADVITKSVESCKNQ